MRRFRTILNLKHKQCYTAECEVEIKDDQNLQFLKRLLTHMRHTTAVVLVFQCGFSVLQGNGLVLWPVTCRAHVDQPS